ncbi:plastocyanin/azurin family copper-binding protein [Alphaproteobacteria bacterium]|jgi:pseudoazurin|nr:plastocyanin/azurin family copper-binding protein [Alphaproteobacteria bacterium]
MFKSKIAILISTMFIILFSGHLMAASHQIDMLNKLGKERMVFSKKVISVDVNDDVLWKSVNKGHNVEFIGMPEGVKKYKSKISKEASYKFEKPGIYLYQCTPHKAMGMIGIVIVGNDKSNLEKIKKVKVYGKSKKLLKSLLADL